MFGSIVNTIKSRLTTRVGDESCQPYRKQFSDSGSRNIFLKLLHSGYAIVSQNQEEIIGQENLFMLPRVVLQNKESVGFWSPVSLKPREKSLDELDSVVEKFIRCINLENCDDNSNVNMNRKLPCLCSFPSTSSIKVIRLINGLFPFPISFQRKNDREAIRRRLAMGEEDDYFMDLAASRPIRKPNLQSRLQNGSY